MGVVGAHEIPPDQEDVVAELISESQNREGQFQRQVHAAGLEDRPVTRIFGFKGWINARRVKSGRPA